MSTGKYLVILWAGFLASGWLYSADERLRLKRADVLENITVAGRATQYLRGNVVFTKGDLTLVCDRARYHEKSGQGSLTGRVQATRQAQTLVCDSLHFDSPNNLMRGFGNAHIWDGDYDLVADTLFYFTRTDSGIARGRVRLTQQSQVISARRITYSKPPGAEAASYTAQGDVHITEGERVATCGQAVYAREQGITRLRIQPQVTEGKRRISGDEIELHYENEVLKYLFIPARARVLSGTSGWKEREHVKGAPKRRIPVEVEDTMDGSVLQGFFVDGVLDSLSLEGMASTFYNLFEDSLYQGRNQASGNQIGMRFVDQELERISIRGGARGVYQPDSANRSIDGPIHYQSDDIKYRVAAEETDLLGTANIRYLDVTMDAGFVTVDWKKNLLKAFPSIPGDTTGRMLMPAITEPGRDPMYGRELTYNLQTRHGRVTRGRTKSGDGFYAGTEIRNQDEETFYIKNSTYTTCDLDTPHFQFAGRRLKMITDDKVVARPIVLSLAGIPVAGLPYGIFPNQGGTRHSGWLMPGYGESRTRGQFIDGLGYYWAPSDYWDTKLQIDFSDRQGLRLRNLNHYNRRYRFSGNLQLEAAQKLELENDIAHLFEPGNRTDYVVRWTHRHVLRREQSLNANVTYQSNTDYNLENSQDLVKRLEQQAISNISYTKRWKGTKYSLSANLSSTRDLMAGEKITPQSKFYEEPLRAGSQVAVTTSTLPRISLRRGQDNLFKSRGRAYHWYHNISWNYGANYNNKLKTYYESEALPDTSGRYHWNPEIQTFSDNILTHTASFSAPQKIFRYLTVNPGLSLKSDWVNKTFTAGLDSSTNQLRKLPVTGFATRTTGDFSVNLKTQVYGLFPLALGSLRAVRHVISPSLGYTYRPDFSRPLFGQELGYVQTLTDSAGQTLKHDRFAGTLAGATSQSELQALTMSLNNAFQAKLVRDDKEQKQDLFTWNMGTSYNFAAEAFRLANLNSTIRTRLTPKLNVNLSMAHDFYRLDPQTGQRIDEIRTSDRGLPWPRLVNVRLSQGFSFAGRRLQVAPSPADTTADTTGSKVYLDEPILETRLGEVVEPLQGGQLWTASFNFSYSLSNPNTASERKSFQMSSNITLQLTQAWRIRYNASFNLVEKTLLHHNFSIYRDLHCWELSLNWTPSGYSRGFYLRINVKSPTLRDLKFEQRGGRRSQTWL